MTLSKVWEKLRKQNKNQYRQFLFCVGFAVMLISSYLFMLYSPIIQNTLPEGGDSRKQVMMIFFIAAVGCIIFVVYATGLFLRHKSKEVGIFLALGTEKRKVKKALVGDVTKCVGKVALAGFLTGGIIALLLGKMFELLAKKVTEEHFAFTAIGVIFSISYAVLLFLIILFMVLRFMKKSDIMDILNGQRKQEPLKRIVTTKYLFSGFVMIAAGIFGGYIFPFLIVKIFNHFPGIWTNLFYILALVGLYRIMVYSISSHKKGKNPQKYYNNLIATGTLKFQGRSIVRNMLVITLLIIGGIFAVFYIPLTNISRKETLKQYEAMYSYFYTEDADELTEEEVYQMAERHGMEIQNYREGEFVQCVGSGINREDVDENNNLLEIYKEKYAVYELISVSQYEALTGDTIEVTDGTYYMIQKPNGQESFYNKFDDMDQVYLEKENKFLPLEYAGNVTYQSLVKGQWGFDERSRYVVSDNNYEEIKGGTAEYPKIKQVLFDSPRGENAIAFANDLYREFALRMSDSMKVCGAYDMYQKSLAGDDYVYDGRVIYDPENSIRETDWQYKPTLVVIEEEGGAMTFIVYILLFTYVGVICLASVSIVSYARSQSVGLNSRMLFQDLEKLGANHAYLKTLLKDQIKKVYVLPTLIGCIGILLFIMLLFFMNDGALSKDEISVLPILINIIIAVMVFQYCMYRFSVRKVKEMLGLNKC